MSACLLHHTWHAPYQVVMKTVIDQTSAIIHYASTPIIQHISARQCGLDKYKAPWPAANSAKRSTCALIATCQHITLTQYVVCAIHPDCWVCLISGRCAACCMPGLDDMLAAMHATGSQAVGPLTSAHDVPQRSAALTARQMRGRHAGTLRSLALVKVTSKEAPLRKHVVLALFSSCIYSTVLTVTRHWSATRPLPFLPVQRQTMPVRQEDWSRWRTTCNSTQHKSHQSLILKPLPPLSKIASTAPDTLHDTRRPGASISHSESTQM